MQWPVPAQTQQTQRGDTLRPPARDTTDSSRARRDSIVDASLAPTARAEAAGIEPFYRWTRDAIFVSGAVTLAELLELTPGVLVLRSGYLSSPAVVSYLGDIARVRVFYDGLELDGLDPRTGGILDLVEVPLWSAEEVRLERGAGDLRVHLRTMRVKSVTAITRTDIYTGDEDTNLYRGFYGRRFPWGGALQVGALQYSTASRRVTGGGDELSLFARTGWARGRFSVDGFFVRASRTREEQLRADARSVPPFEGRRTDAYLRAAYGDPEGGPWAQLIAGSHRFEERTPGTGGPPPADPDDPIPSADTVRSRAQYVATAGTTVLGLRLSATNRLRVFEGNHFNDQSARVSLERGGLALSLFGERAASDSTTRADAVARLALTSFLWVGGSATQRWDDDERVGGADTRAYRAEAGVRLRELNFSGGVLARDSTRLPPAAVFDTIFEARDDGAALATFATAHGRVWRDIFVQANAIAWDEAGPYRPKFQTRIEGYLSTRWLSRFPSGNFGVMISAIHESRSETCFPLRGGACETVPASQVVSTVLELRLLQAVLSWRLENARGSIYNHVPGYAMPRAVSIYGVRWEFRN